MAARLKDQHKSSTSKTRKNPKSKRSPATGKRRSPDPKTTWAPNVPHCGLCGATENLTKTECCGNWICDDEHNYRLFSYAHSSCARNHRRYTLCASHFTEGHSGRWQDCKKCRNDVETEMYVYYATNEFNFEVLENPPKFKPTICSRCGAVIHLAKGGYSSGANGHICGECSMAEHPELRKVLRQLQGST
jgi:hypothetical protein